MNLPRSADLSVLDLDAPEPVPAQGSYRDQGDGATAYTVPGLTAGAGAETAQMLQRRLDALLDLGLVLKHVHWNVVGPTFVAVHEMLDPMHEGVRHMVDDTAERVATLGASPVGLAGHLVGHRLATEYPHGRAQVPVHLRELDRRFAAVISDHRIAISILDDLDPVSCDLLVSQTRRLERYQWFVRAHLESTDGSIERGSADGASGPAPAARRTAAAQAAR